MKEKIQIDIWDLINIEDVNNILEEYLEKKGHCGIPSNIEYKCLDITEEGTVTVESDFEIEDMI